VLSTGLVLVACANQQTGVADCQLSASASVAARFDEVEQKLETPACHYSWQVYLTDLLAVAKGAPGPDNEARFAALLRTAIDRGIISRRQGQEIFSRYFDAEFYAVKSEPRSSCSALQDKDNMLAAMRRELDYKRVGMLDVLSDQQRFRQAQHHFSDLQLVFEAVEFACHET
jgi:hypothetical protein